MIDAPVCDLQVRPDLEDKHDENYFGCSRCLIWSLVFEAALMIVASLCWILWLVARECFTQVAG